MIKIIIPNVVDCIYGWERVFVLTIVVNVSRGKEKPRPDEMGPVRKPPNVGTWTNYTKVW